jgi:CheY-like chemotaxis protein
MKLRFGLAVKKKRTEMGISQENLAERAGLHRTYISDVERGARNPSLESITRLAQALDLSLPALFERATNQGVEGGMVEILLVEDNPIDVEMTMHAFKKARLGNPLHVVRDGVEALDFIFATGGYAYRREIDRPMVILLDLNLPLMGGIEVLRRIKADPRTRRIPVVVLTVSTRDSDIAECRRLGVAAYIVKPVGFQNFSETIAKLEMEWALIKATPGARDEEGGE